jgi:hypothetical protein
MRTLAPVLALVFVAWTAAAEAEVTVTIHDGRVSIAAKDATVRQILAEWARVGQTRIINAERIPGAPLTMELTDVPEQQALEILLRAVSGYLAAPRATVVSNASVFDRIVVMPTTVAPSVPVSAPPNTPSQAGMPPRVFDDQDDDRAFPGVPVQGRPPVFAIPPPPVNGGPQAPLPAGMPAAPTQGQVVFPGVTPQPNAGPTPAPTPIRPGAPSGPVPTGSSIPGMVVPGPTQAPPPPPGLPVQVFPAQPGQPYPAQPQ